MVLRIIVKVSGRKCFVALLLWDSSVGIATRYGLDGPWIESMWGGGILRTHPDRP